jgi:hypothetical protein
LCFSAKNKNRSAKPVPLLDLRMVSMPPYRAEKAACVGKTLFKGFGRGVGSEQGSFENTLTVEDFGGLAVAAHNIH